MGTLVLPVDVEHQVMTLIRFMAIVSKDATEEYGDVYALNFVYSGSFLNEIEVNAQGNTRISMGLGEKHLPTP